MIVVGFVLAAAAGTLARLGLARGLPHPVGLPLGTLVANLAGSFAVGLASGWDGGGEAVVVVAGLGGLTTFSTFAGELDGLRSRPRIAGAYLVASVVGGVGLALVGRSLA